VSECVCDCQFADDEEKEEEECQRRADDPKLISSIESSIPTKTLTRQIQTGPAKLKMILVDNQNRIRRRLEDHSGFRFTSHFVSFVRFDITAHPDDNKPQQEPHGESPPQSAGRCSMPNPASTLNEVLAAIALSRGVGVILESMACKVYHLYGVCFI
jgi:hypothetical protein